MRINGSMIGVSVAAIRRCSRDWSATCAARGCRAAASSRWRAPSRVAPPSPPAVGVAARPRQPRPPSRRPTGGCARRQRRRSGRTDDRRRVRAHRRADCPRRRPSTHRRDRCRFDRRDRTTAPTAAQRPGRRARRYHRLDDRRNRWTTIQPRHLQSGARSDHLVPLLLRSGFQHPARPRGVLHEQRPSLHIQDAQGGDWSDGVPLTAQDFVYSIRRRLIRAPAMATPRSGTA